MRKTCKSDLLQQLESEVSKNVLHDLESFERSATVLIRDGMALLQFFNIKTYRTFGEFVLGKDSSVMTLCIGMDVFTVASSTFLQKYLK